MRARDFPFVSTLFPEESFIYLFISLKHNHSILLYLNHGSSHKQKVAPLSPFMKIMAFHPFKTTFRHCRTVDHSSGLPSHLKSTITIYLAPPLTIAKTLYRLQSYVMGSLAQSNSYTDCKDEE